MRFVCERCQTRYSIADEKVRQRILRIRCKTCGNVILVEDKSGGGTDSALRTKPAAEPVREPHGGAIAKPAPSGGPKVPPPKAAPVVPPPPPPPPDDDEPGSQAEWFVAIHGVQSGPYTLAEAAKQILAVEHGKSVHVWKEGMPKWKPSSEVSVIARELDQLRGKMRPQPPTKAMPPPPPTDFAAESGPPTKRDVLPESPAPHHFPGQPLTPGPEVPLDDQDTPPDPRVLRFTDNTTKKGKDLQDLGRLLEQDDFGEATTQKGKSPRVVEVQQGSAPATVVLPKNEQKKAPPAPKPAKSPKPTDKTPPPERPLPPVADKPTDKTPPPERPLPPVVAKTSERAATPPPLPMAKAKAMEKTPPPTRPLPPVGARAVEKPGPAAVHPPSAVSTKPPVPSVSAMGSLGMASAEITPGLGVDVVLDGMEEVSETGSDAIARHIATSLFQESPLGGVLQGSMASSAGQRSVAPLQPGAPVVGQLAAPGRSSWAGETALMPRATPARHRGLIYLAAAAGLVILVIVLVVFTLRGDGSKAPQPVKPPPAEIPRQPAKVEPIQVEASEPQNSGTQVIAPIAQERPARGDRRRGGKRGKGRAAHVAEPAPQPMPAPSRAEGARPNPFSPRAAVSQDRISAVVRNVNNQAMLKNCYERALKRDNHLTSGRIEVTVSVGMSGNVERVVINAPASFILVEPCIKNAVKRWTFPPSSEDYATNFPLIMQGGM